MPLGVKSAEIGLHAKRTAVVAQHLPEFGHRGAALQRRRHHEPLTVLKIRIRSRYIICGSVHHRKPRVIEPYPGLARGGVGGVEKRHIGAGGISGIKTPHIIVGMTRITVLP